MWIPTESTRKSLMFQIGDPVAVFEAMVMERVYGVVLNYKPSRKTHARYSDPKYTEYLVSTAFDISWQCLDKDDIYHPSKLKHSLMPVLVPHSLLIRRTDLPSQDTCDVITPNDWKYIGFLKDETNTRKTKSLQPGHEVNFN